MRTLKTLHKVFLGCLFMIIMVTACNYPKESIEARDSLTNSEPQFAYSETFMVRDKKQEYFFKIKFGANDKKVIDDYKKMSPFLKVKKSEYSLETSDLPENNNVDNGSVNESEDNSSFQFSVVETNVPKGYEASVEFDNIPSSSLKISGACVNPETKTSSGNITNDFATGIRLYHNNSTGCEAIVAYHSKAWYGWSQQYSKTINKGGVDAFFASNYTTRVGVKATITYNSSIANPIKLSTWYF